MAVTNGEIHAQVKDTGKVDDWVRPFQNQPNRDLSKYENVKLVVRDSAGQETGRYNLGENLPTCTPISCATVRSDTCSSASRSATIEIGMAEGVPFADYLHDWDG